MADSPLEVLAGHSPVLILGKGGVGKSTAAAGLALAWAELGGATPHLISTDPAHSLGDVLGEPVGGTPRGTRCHPSLTAEELDPQGFAARWLGDGAPALAELIEHGTLLDAEDAAGLVELGLPGVDEVMGALRLAELTEQSPEVVVDTAPMAHTLRLLDAGAIVTGWVDALQAMAQRAAAVASGLTGAAVRFSGESLLERMAEGVTRFRSVLAHAAIVVVYRNEHLVRGDTALLLAELERRGLRPAVLLATGPPGEALARAPGWWAPWQEGPRGCDGLRRWFALLQPIAAGLPAAARPRQLAGAPRTGEAARWLRELPQRLLLFVGKGGVGRTTCAAAAALVRADAGPTVLLGTGAGASLAAVFGLDSDTFDARVGAGLRLRRVDAAARFTELRDGYRDDVRAVFTRLGLDESLRMDRVILERLWSLAPPGIDELIALLEISASLEKDETLVVDAAATGHFLRLLAMPALARDWTDALMRILLRLHATGLEDVVEDVLQFSRRLKRLTAQLTDPGATGAFAVTLDEPVVVAESARLHDALRAARVPTLAWILNRATVPAVAAATPAVARDRESRLILAPAQDPAPGGLDGLRRFADAWELVA